MAEEIINKVEASGIVSLDLETIIPPYTVSEIDLAEQLWQGLAVRESDFREWIKTTDFSIYHDHIIALHCSADALIPTWAWMLLTSAVQPHARFVAQGRKDEVERAYVTSCIRSVDRKLFDEKRVVVKGCSTRTLPAAAFIELTVYLQPVVKTLMFGEPCSTVPVYKQPRKKV